MEFPSDPLAFLDLISDEHKVRLRKRKKIGDSLRYMGEAVDQIGRGEEFMRIYVFNPNPEIPTPEDSETDLALLQLYEHWRALHSLRPIEPWDGTRLRPWLPPESNPQVPAVLTGDLNRFLQATLHTPVEGIAWKRLDALGNAIESYFSAVRRHTVWSRPSAPQMCSEAAAVLEPQADHHAHMHHGSHLPPSTSPGELRLYQLNELNNIEAAVYSVRFWGFLKWADNLRRKLFDMPVSVFPHDGLSDISFLDQFVLKHFSWHDDVFVSGTCPSWEDQFGRKAFHRYPVGTQGYGIEFLQFHHDLLQSYGEWRKQVGMPAVQAWHPGKHHTCYVLKYTDGGWWGRGGTNGRPVNPEIVVPEFNDENLSDFKTSAELGNYLDACGVVYHGVGHTENCDIKDQYCNTYSLRFYGWHQWIDDLFKRLKEFGRPLFDESKPLDAPLTCSKFKSVQQPLPFLNGRWAFKSFPNEADLTKDTMWLRGEMRLTHSENGELNGKLILSSPGSENFELFGSVDESNVYYEASPAWWDDRGIIVLRAHGKGNAEGVVYDIRATFQPQCPYAEKQVAAFSGYLVCVHNPQNPSEEGRVGSFYSVQLEQRGDADKGRSDLVEQPRHSIIFSRSGTFDVPPGISKVFVRIWGAGGGGGSDGPGVGGDDGKRGGSSRFGAYCFATGGKGGQHGVYQLGKGGEGGLGQGGAKNLPGNSGEKGDTQPGSTGKGGTAGGEGGVGGRRVGLMSNGRPGSEPGGGGSGAQEGRSPAGGGGGGGYSEGEFSVSNDSRIPVVVGMGGRGGDGGFRMGGDGADGRVEISWEENKTGKRE